MIDLLGPFDKNLLDRYHKMVKSDWFHGNMSKQEAEDRLRNQSTGTFLVRFSVNSPKHYVVSKVSDNAIKHVLVLFKPNEGFTFNKTTYPTFDDLLKDSEKTLGIKPKLACSNSIFQVIRTPFSPYERTND